MSSYYKYLFLLAAAACGGSTSAGPDASGEIDAARDPDGPIFLSFDTNVEHITEGESIRFIAVLTDPDGIDDLIGGVLTTPDGVTSLGAFATSGEEGAYSLELSWDEFDIAEQLVFAQPVAREFVATFFDAAGHEASLGVSVGYYCGDNDHACLGECIDVDTHFVHCGACDMTCPSGSQCGAGECRGVFFNEDARTSCSDFCASLSYSCSATCAGEPGGVAPLGSSGTGPFAGESRYGSTGLFTIECDAVPPARLQDRDWDWSRCCCDVR